MTAVCGAVDGLRHHSSLWLHYLRQSPEAREVLAVTEDGTPDTVGMGLPTVGEASE